MSRLAIILNCLLIFTQAAWCTKWFRGSYGLDHASSWLDGHIPCAQDQIVFPSYYPAVLPLPLTLHTNGFVLPRDGALLLDQDSEINFGDDGHKCESNADLRAYLKEPAIRKWYNPGVWANPKQMQPNPAIPELERIPCDNEEVIVTRSNGPLAFDLEQVPFLRLGQFSLVGSSISKDYLQQLLGTDLGQLLFHNADTVRVEYYHDGACGCHKNFDRMLEPVCHNVQSSPSADTFCARPHCLSPVTPFGACCAICGAVLRFQVEYCAGEKLKQLRKIVDDKLAQEDMINDLNVHFHYVSSDEYGNYLQAIIMDRGAYGERSVEFMRRLNASESLQKWLHENSKELHIVHFAGRAYNPNITFGSVLLILGCIVFVGIVAIVIFAHYAPNNTHLNRIPQWLHDTRRWRILLQRSNFVFARFDNSAATAGRESAVEHLNIGECILGYDAESGELRERAFDNPMFREQRAASCETEHDAATTTTEEGNEADKLGMGPPPEQLATDSIEEQELTEIHLGTSDESESEAETVK